MSQQECKNYIKVKMLFYRKEKGCGSMKFNMKPSDPPEPEHTRRTRPENATTAPTRTVRRGFSQ
jgi:hypothetical protein